MFKLFNKKKPNNTSNENTTSTTPTWDDAATAALDQALAQTPVPKMLKGRVKNELKQAAEQHAAAAGRTTVTSEDLMAGLMSKLPDNMKHKVEQAAKQGPDGLKNLEKELKNNP